ncbi:MAG TPA: TetR/AcrR family transcriptional regulator [Solirubrobacterales bacterium]|jgi:AcrR family transcriptional regulator|nr:TetR/AcrR family transcriptional regulator [Solirubrobacterales bacterium]
MEDGSTAVALRTQRAATTREAILRRAVDLASVEGLEGLTIGRLASELGMSKSGLFRHFGSKQELQLATVDAASERFIAEVVEPALKEDEGAPRLRALCDGYLDHLESAVFSGGCFWAETSSEFDSRPGPVRDKVRDAVQAWVDGLAQLARVAGVEDPDQLAFELHSVAQGANQRFQLFGDENAFARARATFERLLP